MKKYKFEIIFFIVAIPSVVGIGVGINHELNPSFTAVVQDSIKPVVHISCPQWQGSGFVISEHLIVTARHVVEGVEDFEITFSCGNKVKATKAISDKEHDIGFIWVDEPLPKKFIAELGSIEDCVLGQDMFAIGNPYGKDNFNSVTKGIISGLGRNHDYTDMYGNEYGWAVSFTTDAAGHPGNSGCPVFTMDGKVRGILVGGFSPVLIICMPVDIFLEDIDELRLMFIQDRYAFEKEEIYDYGYVDEIKIGPYPGDIR